MKPTRLVLLPKLAKIMAQTGENIKLARLRRKLSTEQVAERDISRPTLWSIEKGSGTVAMGAYAQVLFVLGNISESDNSLEFDLAMEVAEYFRVDAKKGRSIVTKTKKVVERWNDIAEGAGISKSERTSISNCFRYE